MCPAFGSLRVGLRMRRTATILSGSACCVYGLTFTSHFYGAKRTVGYVPFDFKKQDWCADSDWKWHSMAIKRYMLPALAAVGDTLGFVTADAAKSTGLPEGVPVIAGAADKACEVLGVGALEPGVASVSCGTTATINTTPVQTPAMFCILPTSRPHGFGRFVSTALAMLGLGWVSYVA